MKIAVVGAGISGLSAAWLLSRTHDVTVFEKEPRLGGHSHTVQVPETGGAEVAVDTGFIVYNVASYPNLIALFERLAVPTVPTEMSFSVSLDGGTFEYNGNGLPGLFGQRRNLLSPRHWGMVRDTLRFFREASHLDPDHDPAESLGDWLAARRYGRAFIERHILPMGAAIWSAPAEEILSFPVAAFARFFDNHGLLQIADRPQWRTVEGGSIEYVRRLKADTSARFAAGDPVVDVTRDPQSVTVRTASGTAQRFDQCVLACHADEALALLGDADEPERRLLGAFRYSANDTYLHTDARHMPRRRRLWTSWNYLGHGPGQRLAVSYWMNRLQPLSTRQDYFVTLNPAVPVDPSRIVRRLSYAHPIFDAAAMSAQRDLWSLQGQRRTWFAGSYFGYGFHEDGLQAGLAVAEDLGGLRRPWHVLGDRDRILSLGARPGLSGKLRPREPQPVEAA